MGPWRADLWVGTGIRSWELSGLERFWEADLAAVHGGLRNAGLLPSVGS